MDEADSPCQGCLESLAAREASAERRDIWALGGRLDRLEDRADRRADVFALLVCLAVLLVAAWHMGWIRLADVLPGKGA